LRRFGNSLGLGWENTYTDRTLSNSSLFPVTQRAGAHRPPIR